METAALSTMFDLASIKLKGCYVVEVMGDDFYWRTEPSFEGKPGTLKEVVAAAEQLVNPSSFDRDAESVPREVRITRVGRFLKVGIESTPAVETAPLQLRVCYMGGSPDLSPAKGPDPIAVGQKGWVPAGYPFLAYHPAALVAAAERALSGEALVARIFREVDGMSYELWSAAAQPKG